MKEMFVAKACVNPKSNNESVGCLNDERNVVSSLLMPNRHIGFPSPHSLIPHDFLRGGRARLGHNQALSIILSSD
jgi:hypothetical protein